MKYLLDTHIWLWSLLEPDKLGKEIMELLEDNGNEISISPITVWETLVLAIKGRIELYPSPEEWITEAISKTPAKEAPLSHSIAIKSLLIDLPHKDPADRFIAATAWEYDLTLITLDDKIKKVKQIKIF